MMQIEINKKYLGHFDGYVKLMCIMQRPLRLSVCPIYSHVTKDNCKIAART